MEIISYISLYNYLTKVECLSNMEAVRSINRIRRLDPQIKMALSVWIRTGIVDLTVNGISFNELTKEDGFSPIRAFFMLDWIKREPVNAMKYMAVERMNVSAPPSEELQGKLRHLLQKEGKTMPADLDDDKNDITVE